MTSDRDVRFGSARVGNWLPFALLAGPCVAESESLCVEIARYLKGVTAKLGIPYVFKASYDKANRSSSASFRGLGMAEGLRILAAVKKKVGVPVVTDVHSAEEVPAVAAVADVLQIPAFLCRQTDLVLAAVKTGKIVNIKKGQFLAPWDAKNIVAKADAAGGKGRTLLTERGVTFGYNNLIVDMRSLEVMKSFGAPVVFDATHSVQLPGGQGSSSGGQREFIWPLARAAAAVGVAAFFMEVHPTPEKALSDGPNAVRLRHMPDLLKRLKSIDAVVKKSRFTENPFR